MMKKILSLLAAFGVMFYLSSCNDDDDPIITFEDVEVSGQTGVVTLENGQTGASAVFSVTVDAGLTATYAVTTTGDVTVTSDETGTVSGATVTVSFDAGTTAGPAAIILTVTDSEGDVATDEANFVINEVGDNVPSIAGIPASATITLGGDLTVPDVVLTAEDGFAASNAFTVNGTDLGLVTGTSTSPATVEIAADAATLTALGVTAAGIYELEFELTDSDGDVAAFTHVLTVEAAQTVFEITGNITENTTWSTGNVYNLEARVTVVSGVTLTIEPGVIIKGGAGTGSNSKALLVARGATLNAVGTATAPIIMTSVADNIEPGQIVSPNLTDDVNGLWGGLIVLGNARISADNESEQIEGIPASDANGLYGGTADDDNSGTIQYVSVRHGGTNIGEGNEINGITLGGVGSGTTIDHVEVVGNADDGIEWFGGTVNVSDALVWSVGDDAIDTDQAWAGTLDNFIVINAGDEAFELDGPEGSYQGAGHTITNGSVKVAGASGMIDFDDNTDVTMSNIYFFDLDETQDVEGYTGYSANTNGFTATSFESTLPFEFDASEEERLATTTTLDVVFVDGLDAEVDEVAAGANTVGATVSEFTFTLASQTGALDDF